MSANKQSPRYQIHRALLCESYGAMWTQTLKVNHNTITYKQVPLDLPEFMGDQCFKTPSMNNLLNDTHIKETILTVAKYKQHDPKDKQHDCTVTLDYTDFS